MSYSTLNQQLASFDAVYCSGLFPPDLALVTAMSLIFEKVHFLDDLRPVLNFAKGASWTLGPDRSPLTFSMKDGTTDEAADALSKMAANERAAVDAYLYFTGLFFGRFSPLLGSVFSTRSLPEGNPFEMKPAGKMAGFGLPVYEMVPKSLSLVLDDESAMMSLLRDGGVPVVSTEVVTVRHGEDAKLTARSLAATLAIKAVQLAFPKTHPVDDPFLILEARDRLRDQLPPFWSAMLKLSVQLKELVKDDPSGIEKEADYLVDTLVRPALIELVDKLEKDRRNWFFKILSPVAKGLRVIVGKSPLSGERLLAASLQVAGEAALDVAEQVRQVQAMKNESGLAYLIDLHEAGGK